MDGRLQDNTDAQFTTIHNRCIMFLACDSCIHPMYRISLKEVSSLSFLIEESLSSFLSSRFFTRLYQTVQLYMYKIPVLIELITYCQFCYLSKSISPRQILRLLERRFIILRRPRFKLHAYVCSNKVYSNLTIIAIVL